MGLFGSGEVTVPVDVENVSVFPGLAARLPDAGEFLLDLISFLDDGSLQSVQASIAGIRHPNGAITGVSLDGVGVRDWKKGPITHLVWLTAKDSILLEVWASFGLGRRDGQRLGKGARQVYATQGMPAAATWVLNSRPDARLDLDFLADQLTGSWAESAAHISNGDIIKSFKKWQHD